MGMGHPGSKGCRICRHLESNGKTNQKMTYFFLLPCMAVLSTLSNKRLLLLRQTAALPPQCAITVTSPSRLSCTVTLCLSARFLPLAVHCARYCCIFFKPSFFNLFHRYPLYLPLKNCLYLLSLFTQFLLTLQPIPVP